MGNWVDDYRRGARDLQQRITLGATQAPHVHTCTSSSTMPGEPEAVSMAANTAAPRAGEGFGKSRHTISTAKAAPPDSVSEGAAAVATSCAELATNDSEGGGGWTLSERMTDALLPIKTTSDRAENAADKPRLLVPTTTLPANIGGTCRCRGRGAHTTDTGATAQAAADGASGMG